MKNEREILRALAGEIAEIAHLDTQKERARLHRAVNSLRMERPIVFLDELPWNQLNDNGELTLKCQDEFLRSIEQEFLRTLYRWRHCPGDMLIEPFYRLNRAIEIGDIGVRIVEDTIAHDEGNNIVSHHYIDQLPDMDSLERLHAPTIRVDDQLTESRRQWLDGLFGDLLPVRVTGLTNAGFYMPWDNLSMWRGADKLLMDLSDNPDLLHAFMRRFVDIRLDMLRREEELNLLDADIGMLHCTAALVDELPGETVNGRVTRKNLWGRGTAQIFASVSPQMHDEFEIEYAKAFFDGFGLLYYGCCEPLHKKMHIVKKLPNLRKISITPWADVRASAERMGGDYVLSRKPNPASVAVPVLNEDLLRQDILETLIACKDNNTPCEFILKDISTVAYNPNNLARWETVVRETVKNF